LSADEARFLATERPAGIILFSRNCTDPTAVARLVTDAKTAIGAADVLVAIDQEGGRVQRLKPPTWRALPAAAAFDRLALTAGLEAACDAARRVARLTAADLAALGINMNCAPVLDVPVAGAHGVIGDRAYAEDPDRVTMFGRAVIEGFTAGGVVAVVKHVPGHGRARADSHLELPVVEADRATLDATDFAPFRALASAPAAMTAHVVFRALDDRNPASTSPAVIRSLVRETFGFDGLLMSDDLGMAALSGSIAERAAAVIAAGSDVALQCSGRLEDMRAAAAAVPPLDGRAAERLHRCLDLTRRFEPFDPSAAEDALGRALEAGTGQPPAPSATSIVESV
jgi:beta-N-acetylhexosaminidase